MTREQKSGKAYSKHISMELTADSARVTNLSLEGSRLVLTIEAELEGSHLRSTDDATQKTAPTQEQEKQQQPAPDSSHAPNLGQAQPEDPEPGILNMGSENLPPASAAFTPDRLEAGEAAMGTLSTPLPQSLAVNPDDISGPDHPAVGPTLFERAATTIDPAQESCSCCGLEDSTMPVLDTLDSTSFDGPSAGPVTPPPLPVIDPPATTSPTTPEAGKQGSAPKRWDAPELVSEDSSRDVITHPTASDSEKPFTSSHASESSMGGQLALSEESSAIGGVRHGEPQPAISFGQDMPEQSCGATPASESTPAAAVPPPIPPALPAPEAEKPTHGAKEKKEEEEEAKSKQSDEVKKEAEKEKEKDAPSESKDKTSDTGDSAKPKSDGEQGDSKSAGGSTTVLIRYTCPKCKTQGMQAVDKVGTVVNCSNCGKAMRLVMKK